MGHTPTSYGTLTIETSLDPLSSSVSSVVRGQGNPGWDSPARPDPQLRPAAPAPPPPGLLSPAFPEAQRLLWQSVEGYRLSRRGLDDGRDPFAAVPVEAGLGGAAAAPAVQPGPRRNTRHRNKRQRGERPSRGWRRVAGGWGRGGWRMLRLSAEPGYFPWDLTQVLLSGTQLLHLSCGRKGQVGWFLRRSPGSPGCGEGPGSGGVSSRTESTPPCSRIVRGSSTLSRYRPRPSARAGEAAPSPLPRSACSPWTLTHMGSDPGTPPSQGGKVALGMRRRGGSSQSSIVTATSPQPGAAPTGPGRGQPEPGRCRGSARGYMEGHRPSDQE